jgi:ABC-2 type transport system ATP-binding protein
MTEDRVPVVSVRDVRKTYGSVRALDGFSMDVCEGETVGLIGPNGAGKTTLLESIIGTRFPDEGRIDVMGLSPRDGGAAVRKLASLQPQGSSAYKYLTVQEHIILWQALYDRSGDAGPVIEMVGLQEKARQRVSTLSGGQLQRLRLALALAGQTAIILLDEPTVGLDPAGREGVWNIIRHHMARGSVLLTTQNMEEAEALCDRIIVIDRGKNVAMGTPDRLLRDFAGQGSASFLSDGPLDQAALLALPGVTWASAQPVGSGSSVRLITHDQANTRLAVTRQFGGAVSRYRTSGPTLNDVFLTLVADPSPQDQP